MEDFDIFTNKIEFTKTLIKNTLNKLVYDHHSTPIGPNYESGRKLVAEQCLANGDEEGCAFHLSEAVSSTVRTMMLYREEQIRAAGDKQYKISPYLKPVSELTSTHPLSKAEQSILETFNNETTDSPAPAPAPDTFNNFTIDEEEVPFYKQYLRFSDVNNVDNFKRILKELPEEWSIVQLSVGYNGRENVSPREVFRTDVAGGLLLTVLAGDHVTTPFTIHIPANITKEGEKPLFAELYSILEENYRTIDNAHLLNNKRLVQNYWAKREDIDLRMKSVIKAMDERWTGGWSCLMSGRLASRALRDTLVARVDAHIDDWGFIGVTSKQRMLLYRLLSSSSSGQLTSQQVAACLRRILTEHGDLHQLRELLEPCQHCTKAFRYVSEVCRGCLSRCFERVHRVGVEEAVRAFLELARELREGEQWAALRRAVLTTLPVILIVDEILDSFPWESLPGLKSQAVSRVDNIHSLYHLYKTHEPRVLRGHYVTTAERGRYVINPEKNLDHMERRMSSFVRYWCPAWSGHAGRAPPPDDFLAYLQTADIFLYCGHGDGCQFGSGGGGGAGVEGVGAGAARAVCVLSGCGSARLAATRGRQPPGAPHRRLHVAGVPALVGMLWEVTDLEVDKLVTALLALAVPSAAPVPWRAVGKADWSRGVLDTGGVCGGGGGDAKGAGGERELLRAVCRARDSTSYLMIASSVVVRGLPVAILTDKTT